MEIKRFQRRIEDFTCNHCRTEVVGDGYTNHCPNCLYSKHVDQNPGDRLSQCQGLMAPIDIIIKGGLPVSIVHRCERCGFHRPNKISESDNREALFAIPTSSAAIQAKKDS